MNIVCIYIIKSKTKPEHSYVGSSINFTKRKKEHLNKLENGKHANILLLNHARKYGIVDLYFEILEEVSDISVLLNREQHYIDSLKPRFNVNKTAGSSLGTKRTDEQKVKLSKALKGVKKPPRSLEHRMNISKSWVGRKISDEARANRSKAAKNKVFSEQHRINLGLAMKGKKFSDEHRLNLSNAHMGHKRSTESCLKQSETLLRKHKVA